MDQLPQILKNKIFKYWKSFNQPKKSPKKRARCEDQLRESPKKRVRCHCADPYYDYLTPDDWNSCYGDCWRSHQDRGEEPYW